MHGGPVRIDLRAPGARYRGGPSGDRPRQATGPQLAAVLGHRHQGSRERTGHLHEQLALVGAVGDDGRDDPERRPVERDADSPRPPRLTRCPPPSRPLPRRPRARRARTGPRCSRGAAGSPRRTRRAGWCGSDLDGGPAAGPVHVDPEASGQLVLAIQSPVKTTVSHSMTDVAPVALSVTWTAVTRSVPRMPLTVVRVSSGKR